MYLKLIRGILIRLHEVSFFEKQQEDHHRVTQSHHEQLQDATECGELPYWLRMG
jgi:hypothetical protein